MARDKPVRNRTDATPERPNLVTVVGRGVPANFEISVDGSIELVGEEPTEEAIVVSGGVAEGTIDVGVKRFRFDGEMANVRVLDWNGIAGDESPSAPTVHVEYSAPER